MLILIQNYRDWFILVIAFDLFCPDLISSIQLRVDLTWTMDLYFDAHQRSPELLKASEYQDEIEQLEIGSWFKA